MPNVALSTLGFVTTMASGVSSSPSSSSLTFTLPSYRRGKVYYLPIDRGAAELFLREDGFLYFCRNHS